MALFHLTLWNRLKLDNEEATTAHYLIYVYIKGCCSFILKLRWSIQRTKCEMHCMLWMLTLSRQRIKACNAFNAMHVHTVNTKHIHTFLPITFLIFNQFSIWKMFCKAETQCFPTIPLILYRSTLLMQVISISNAFNAMYVKAVDTFSTQYTHM